jgi:Putative zinc-finger
MTELQTECSQAERINAFLANRLDSESRQAFLAHLSVCEECASLLGDLREDERLARIPLTPQERVQVQAIVRQARQEVVARLAEDHSRQDRREHCREDCHEDCREQSEQPGPARAPQFAPPALALLAPGQRRIVWLSAAAAAAFATALWLLGK